MRDSLSRQEATIAKLRTVADTLIATLPTVTHPIMEQKILKAASDIYINIGMLMSSNMNLAEGIEAAAATAHHGDRHG
jgi:hypothetical protein